MSIEIRKAERKQAKLRIGVSGPSGSGKTMSALKMAFGMTGDWSKIVVIDTESGRGELYAHLGEYSIVRLGAPYSPERYIEYIKACEEAGFSVIIIDSLSHEWEGAGGCLEINETIAQSRFRGNSFTAWSETKPRHRKLIETIINSPAHIIASSRTKIEMVMTDDKKVKKVGMKEIQMEGTEYEWTINFTIDREKHLAVVGKDNTELFEGKDPFIITPDTGRQLMEWAMSGKEAPAPTVTKADIRAYLEREYPILDSKEYGTFIKDNTGLDPNTTEPALVLSALKEAVNKAQ
jgi:hypothetical protein